MEVAVEEAPKAGVACSALAFFKLNTGSRIVLLNVKVGPLISISESESESGSLG